MTETVNTVERHIILFAELFQPAVRGLVVHGFAVPLDKEPVALMPLIAALLSSLLLLSLHLLDHLHQLGVDILLVGTAVDVQIAGARQVLVAELPGIHADLLGQVDGVDGVELDVVLGDVPPGGGKGRYPRGRVP